MSTVPQTKSEILARLLEIHTARLTFDREEADLWARLQKPKGNTPRPKELTFGKDIVTWGDGQALAIKGKGYRLIKALYFANGMRLKVATLGRVVWDNDVPKHRSFKEFIRKIAAKLETALFPYRLIPVKSREKVRNTGKLRKGKPEKRRIQSEIIGARLDATKLGAKVVPDL